MVGPVGLFRVLWATLATFICLFHACRGEAGIIVEVSVHSEIRFSTNTTQSFPTFDATYSLTNPAFSTFHQNSSVKNLQADSYVDNAYFQEDSDDPVTYLNFFQSAQLQLVSGNNFSTSDFLSLEIVTLLTFELSSPALLIGGSLSNPPVQNTGYTFTNSSVGLSAEWSSYSVPPTPLLVDALASVSGGNNAPYLFSKGVHTVTLKSKVIADQFDANSSSLGLVAESRFNVNLAFTAAPVPEPASCLVAGVLFGSAVIGKRLRRRRNA